MSIHEECGVFAIYCNKSMDAAMQTYIGLYALQHRGQESCGIVVNDRGVFSYHKDLGLVSEVFSHDILSKLPMEIWRWGMCATVLQEEITGTTASPWRSTIRRARWRLPITEI